MKLIKTIGKAFDVAFSIYSKIPMPKFTWASEDMKYHLCFFPWVGIVIGMLEFLWAKLWLMAGFGQLFGVTFAMAIPLLVTGGFHMDGFLDTMDAIHSYQDREKKLEILKDPHVGAFAIISLAIYFLLALGFGSQVWTSLFVQGELVGNEALCGFCFCFFFSRCLSGLSVTYLPPAKKDGMLSTFSLTEDKKRVGIVLWIELIVGLCLLLYLCRADLKPICGMVLSLWITFFYYARKSKATFGGITGDLAGWFVTLSELMAVLGLFAGSLL